jgi:hypothetical protein
MARAARKVYDRRGQRQGAVRRPGVADYGDGVVGVLVPGKLDEWVGDLLEPLLGADPDPEGEALLGAFRALWHGTPPVARGRGSVRELVGPREALVPLGMLMREMLGLPWSASTAWERQEAFVVLGRLDFLGVPRGTSEGR